MGRHLPARRSTRVDGIMEAIAARIADGLLKAGERVASIRKAAVEHGVSKNTMAEAYDRLVALGRLEARPGSGYVVSGAARAAPSRSGPHVAEALDLVTLLREQLDQHYEVRPGDGRPPPAWMEGAAFTSRLRRLDAPGGEAEHGYGSSWGFLALRERLSVALAERSIRCPPEQILLTQGANHALDLITRCLLDPGDTVFVDDPGYYPLFGKLRLARVQVVGIRRLADGPDLDDLHAKLATARPRLFFTQSLAHNPTGGSLSLPTAYGVLQAAERHGFCVVEDDPFADVLPASSPRLAALDQLNRVLYVGTFSKTLSASLRVGFVAAHPAIAAALADVKLLTVVATSGHVERFVMRLIASGHYLRHLRRLRGRIETATATALRDLDGIGLHVPRPRDGGFYRWAELPPGIDERALCRRAAARSIFLAPGAVFSWTRASPVPAIRINVAHASHPRFLEFMQQALRDPGLLDDRRHP